MMSHAQNEWVQSSDFETNAKIRNAPVGTNVSSRGVPLLVNLCSAAGTNLSWSLAS